MNRIILADNQAIFRAGAARVLALEDDMRIVAQCEDLTRLSHALDAYRNAILLVSASMQLDLRAVVARALDGVLFRNVPGVDLIDCIRRVGAGQRCVQRSNVTSIVAQDAVGARVRDWLTPKEMQIVALIAQGCKNRQIAEQLHTKEQVIKNYLRSIYDKTGVSDRLELALFTIHHRVLAEAAARAGDLLQAKSA
jgi:DNA-binding NarL/FixJ family response regulator